MDWSPDRSGKVRTWIGLGGGWDAVMAVSWIKRRMAQRGRRAISLFLIDYFQYTKRTITHLLSILRLQVAGLAGVGGISMDLGA
jgi:hypothetical protein